MRKNEQAKKIQGIFYVIYQKLIFLKEKVGVLFSYDNTW